MTDRLSTPKVTGCCSNSEVKFDGASPAYRRALSVVIAINALMFVVEITAGAISGSQALLADSLDFIGDTFTYSISLMVIGMPLHVRAGAALFKGATLAAMGVGVLGTTVWRVMSGGVPDATVIEVVGVLALLANIASVLILLRYRDGDSNVRSVWLCSRNDAIGNVAVIAAGAAVYVTGQAWPDLVVAILMAGLFLFSATRIVRQAYQERKQSLVEIGSPEQHGSG